MDPFPVENKLIESPPIFLMVFTHLNVMEPLIGLPILVDIIKSIKESIINRALSKSINKQVAQYKDCMQTYNIPIYIEQIDHKKRLDKIPPIQCLGYKLTF